MHNCDMSVVMTVCSKVSATCCYIRFFIFRRDGVTIMAVYVKNRQKSFHKFHKKTALLPLYKMSFKTAMISLSFHPAVSKKH